MDHSAARRQFIKTVAALTVSAGFPGGLGYFIDDAFAEGSAFPPHLAVTRGGTPAELARKAVETLGGMKKFVSKGDIVVVKPNIGWDRTPEQAANSNPEVTAEVVKMCFEAGARKVKVFDRTVNDPRRCYVQSGIKAAVEPLGADIHYVDERKFRNMSLKGETLKEWPIYTEVVEADAVINVPIAKHHGLATLTMTIKNWMGVIGGNRSRIHQKLDRALVDIARFVKPKLSVLDAVRVLTANGPQGGSLSDVKRLDMVVAGSDEVAVDAYGSTLFGLEPTHLGYVREGARQGLGRADIDKLRIAKIQL